MDHKRKLYVTLEESHSKKVKLVKSEELGETYSSLESTFQQKFKIVNAKLKISAKVEKDGLFVELEEDDEDFTDILEEAVEFKVTMCKDPAVTHLGEPSQVDLNCTSKESSYKALPTQDIQSDSDSSESSKSLDLSLELSKHPGGEEVYNEYKAHNTLTPQTRITLVNIVCAALVKKHGYYPSPDAKHEAANGIIKLFPNLRDKSGKSGYEHFFSTEGGQTGYIQSRLKNIRRHLSKECQQRPRQTKLTTRRDDNEPLTIQNLPKVTPDKAKELADFCRNAPIGNKAAILRAMKEFTGTRVAWIKDKSPAMSQILKEYPHYLETPEVILQDFEQMFGEEVASNFLMKFVTHSKTILKYVEKSRNPKLAEIQTEYEATSKSDEHCALYGLLALIHLLPSFNTKKKGKCSKEDNVGFFLDKQPIGIDIEDYVQAAEERKQPYILATGADLNNIHQYFIVLDGKAIPSPKSIIYATDMLIKAHFVFNVEYSLQVRDFYIYLQTVIYGISPCQKLSNRVKEVKIALESIEV